MPIERCAILTHRRNNRRPSRFPSTIQRSTSRFNPLIILSLLFFSILVFFGLFYLQCLQELISVVPTEVVVTDEVMTVVADVVAAVNAAVDVVAAVIVVALIVAEVTVAEVTVAADVVALIAAEVMVALTAVMIVADAVPVVVQAAVGAFLPLAAEVGLRPLVPSHLRRMLEPSV